MLTCAAPRRPLGRSPWLDQDVPSTAIVDTRGLRLTRTGTLTSPRPGVPERTLLPDLPPQGEDNSSAPAGDHEVCTGPPS